MFGSLGAFWSGYGLLQWLFAAGTLSQPGAIFPELGYWFIVIGAITAAGTIAALAENVCAATVLATFAAGSGFAAYAYIAGVRSWMPVAGNILVASAIIAWYVGSAILLEATFGRKILPLAIRVSRGATCLGSIRSVKSRASCGRNHASGLQGETSSRLGARLCP